MRKAKKITCFDFVIEKYKELGIEIDIYYMVVKSFAENFDELPNVTRFNDELWFISFKYGVTKELFISKDDKYTYSFGICAF